MFGNNTRWPFDRYWESKWNVPTIQGASVGGKTSVHTGHLADAPTVAAFDAATIADDVGCDALLVATTEPDRGVPNSQTATASTSFRSAISRPTRSPTPRRPDWPSETTTPIPALPSERI